MCFFKIFESAVYSVRLHSIVKYSFNHLCRNFCSWTRELYFALCRTHCMTGGCVCRCDMFIHVHYMCSMQHLIFMKIYLCIYVSIYKYMYIGTGPYTSEPYTIITEQYSALYSRMRLFHSLVLCAHPLQHDCAVCIKQAIIECKYPFSVRMG